MKAIKYSVLIDFDGVHTWSGRDIEEIFVPDAGLIFNNAGGVFRNEKPRVELIYKEVNVLIDDVEKLLVIADELNTKKELLKAYF